MMGGFEIFFPLQLHFKIEAFSGPFSFVTTSAFSWGSFSLSSCGKIMEIGTYKSKRWFSVKQNPLQNLIVIKPSRVDKMPLVTFHTWKAWWFEATYKRPKATTGGSKSGMVEILEMDCSARFGDWQIKGGKFPFKKKIFYLTQTLMGILCGVVRGRVEISGRERECIGKDQMGRGE